MQEPQNLKDLSSAKLYALAETYSKANEPLLAMMIRSEARSAEQRETVALWDAVQ